MLGTMAYKQGLLWWSWIEVSWGRKWCEKRETSSCAQVHFYRTRGWGKWNKVSKDWCKRAAAAGFLSPLAFGRCLHLPVLNIWPYSQSYWVYPPELISFTVKYTQQERKGRGIIKTPKRLWDTGSPVFHSQPISSQQVNFWAYRQFGVLKPSQE